MTTFIFCFDGTNNGPEDEFPTYIRKLHRGLRAAGQVPLYLSGPGEEDDDTWFAALGAAFGINSSGIRDRALDALELVFQEGDRIAVFGFSRGAMIARMFAATVCKNGVNGFDPGIAFLGCFDTVAAFLPFGAAQQSIFHDLHVSPKVKAAYHAVALDEDRSAFAPNLMNHREGVLEVWFKGVHCDVGGGFEDSRLSDVALFWMIANAARHGIIADVETYPDPDAPWEHMGGIWRREDREVFVKVDDERSDLIPMVWRPAAL